MTISGKPHRRTGGDFVRVTIDELMDSLQQ